MKHLTTLRARLLVTYLGLLIVGFGGLTWLAGSQLTSSAYTDFAATLRAQTLFLASSLNESIKEPEEYELTAAQFNQFIQRLGIEEEAEIAILNPTGIVWLASDDAIMGQDLSTTLEVRRAFANEDYYAIRPNASGVDVVYTAAPVFYDEDIVGYIRLGKPASIPRASIRERLMVLGISFFGFSVVGTLASLWLLSTFTRPLNALRNTALHMASGDLTQRVTDLREDEIGEVGMAFNQMATQVEAMVAEQQAFASNASHELRTPLTTIRLRTESIRSGQLDPAIRDEYVAEIDDEVQRMSGLVDDLILLSRLDAQRLAVGGEQVDLTRVVHGVQRDLASLAEAKAIQLTVTEEGERVPPIQANLNHLQVVIRNLLENAIKYTPDGGTVTTTITQIEDVVRLQVADTGQGIAADDLPHLAQRFYRADKAHSRRTEGTGLGLALVQSVIDLYGGKLQIESEGLGRGTTVSVLWPC